MFCIVVVAGLGLPTSRNGFIEVERDGSGRRRMGEKGQAGKRSWSEALLIMMAPAIKLRNGLGLALFRLAFWT